MTATAATAVSANEDELALARAEVLAGDGERATRRLSILLAEDGFSPELHYWLSAAYGASGQKTAQVEALRKAETLHGLQIIKDSGGDLIRFQQDPAYAAEVAETFYKAHLVACASIGYGRAAMEPSVSAELLLKYGLSLQHQGRIEDAVAIFEVVNRAHPVAIAHAALLFATIYGEGGVKRHAAEAKRWAAKFGPPIDPDALDFPNERNPDRRLRIGYVAPSIVRTQIRQFMRPVLEAHDPTAVEVFLYVLDAAAETGLPAAQIRSIDGLSDADAAVLIRADKIDVLVDLWSHAGSGRLGVFALKPAPVQLSWMNTVQTTGLAAIDYVIHYEGLDPPGTADLFVEKIWTLWPTSAPFRPDLRVEPTPAPALRNGYVTFGSFNNPAKLNDQTIAGWARVMLARPGSKLLLKYGYFDDPILQNATCARFAAHGVDPQRLEFRGQTMGVSPVHEFADMDFALDPSPCPGGTTTCEALAAGVPVLTLKGDDFYSRLGAWALLPLGLDELVAESWDDYVDRARAMTESAVALDAFRRRVRDAFDASPLRDEAAFGRCLEAAFREMFARWCAGSETRGP